MNQDITVCITSCGRWDLLERSLKSLIQNWDGPVPKSVLIYEDQSLSLEAIQVFWNGLIDFVWSQTHEWPRIDLFWGKVGQIAAADKLLENCHTKFVFWTEDDFEFFKPGFVKASLDVLASDLKTMQVWLREPNDRNGHPAFGGIRKTGNGTNYQYMSHNFAGGRWRGFSFNPGLRRLSDYHDIGGSYSAIARNTKGLEAESRIGQAYYKKGFRAATLLTGYVKHIGNGRHINE